MREARQTKSGCSSRCGRLPDSFPQLPRRWAAAASFGNTSAYLFMSWENSERLHTAQAGLSARMVRAGETLFLTGGSALGLFYLDHRRSYDLDLFTSR